MMARRGHIAGAIAIYLVGLGVAMARFNPSKGPVLASVPIGMNDNWMAVDEQAGRAFVLGERTIDQVVTLQGNGYFWSGVASSQLTVIDTRSGRRVATLDLPNLPISLALDRRTHRLAVIDTQGGQTQLYDTRTLRLVGTVPYTDSATIQSTVTDNRSGVFIAVAVTQVGSATITRLVALDGHSGTLRWTRELPRLHSIVFRARGKPPIPAAPFPASVAMDARTGHLYVFTGDKRMLVLDPATGRMLSSRRLGIIPIAALVDGARGRIYALMAPWPPLAPPYGPAPYLGIVVLDAHSGRIIQRIVCSCVDQGLHATAVDLGLHRMFVSEMPNQRIIAVDTLSGRVLGRISIDGYAQLLMDDERHRAIVLLFNRFGVGHLALLDTRTLRITRTFTQPSSLQGPSMALDPHTGHLIAITSVMLSGPIDDWSWIPSWLRDRVPNAPTPPPTLGPSQRIIHNTIVTLDLGD